MLCTVPKWQFKLEKMAWWDGLFERMVRSTKRYMYLKKAIDHVKLIYDDFSASLAKV